MYGYMKQFVMQLIFCNNINGYFEMFSFTEGFV